MRLASTRSTLKKSAINDPIKSSICASIAGVVRYSVLSRSKIQDSIWGMLMDGEVSDIQEIWSYGVYDARVSP